MSGFGCLASLWTLRLLDSGFRASPSPPASKASNAGFSRLSPTSRIALLASPIYPIRGTVRAFGLPLPVRRAQTVSPVSGECPARVDRRRNPNMPSADFCAALGEPRGPPSPLPDTTQISRGKFDRLRRTTAGSTLRALDGYGLRGYGLARPTLTPLYPVLLHRLAPLLHASFRPRLTATPLRFANPSPPSGWVGDSHPQAVKHARHTRRGGAWPRPPLPDAPLVETGTPHRHTRASDDRSLAPWGGGDVEAKRSIAESVAFSPPWQPGAGGREARPYGPGARRGGAREPAPTATGARSRKGIPGRGRSPRRGSAPQSGPSSFSA
jgi:hypothetical protein